MQEPQHFCAGACCSIRFGMLSVLINVCMSGTLVPGRQAELGCVSGTSMRSVGLLHLFET